MSMLEAAMRYAQMGLSVIPLHGKVPYFENWPDIATHNPEQIQRWWEQEPRANIGIATGRTSNVFVVDIDPRNGGEESADTLFSRHGRFPDTWTDITGSGGTHYYFRYPAFPVGNKTGIMPGVDIRGDGGQVVAPPSIHPETGKRYMWDGLREPWEEPVAEAPLWLLNLLAPPPQHEKFCLNGWQIPKGVQHHTLVSLAGAMRKMGLSDDEIFPSLMYVNQKRCQEPGPEKNVRAIAHSMMRYQPHDKGLQRQAATLWRLSREAEEALAKKQQAMTDRQKAMSPIDGLSLLTMDFGSVREVIDEVLYNGVTILAGPPKSGKSWLTLGMAIAVSTGGKFISKLNITSPGKVSYFALEETKRRTGTRLKVLKGDDEEAALQNIEFLYALSPMDKGGIQELDAYMETARPTLVIIDTLMAFVTGDRSTRRDIFRDDYREIQSLQVLAGKHDCSIVVVHHTNKAGGHGIQAVAGTHGVTAAADGIWTMQRQPERKALLEMTGREIEDKAFLMQLDIRDGIGWYALEEGDAVVLSQERHEIFSLLMDEGPLTPAQIATELGKNRGAIRMLLKRMRDAHILAPTGGRYKAVTGSEGDDEETGYSQ